MPEEKKINDLVLHPSERRFYSDETGMRIEEGDLLQMYHFRGARKKRYYMYQIAVLQEFGGHLWWAAKDYHVEGNKGHYWLKAVVDKENGIIPGMTVLYKKDAFINEDALRKEARAFWKSKKP